MTIFEGIGKKESLTCVGPEISEKQIDSIGLGQFSLWRIRIFFVKTLLLKRIDVLNGSRHMKSQNGILGIRVAHPVWYKSNDLW
jgi:hypothetical protein